MTIFTIDEQNNITAFASQQEAAAARTTPVDTFSSQKELATLLAGWPAERPVAIWNSLPGVTPVRSLKDPQSAARRIWARIQGLREAAQPEAEAAMPKTQRKAKGGARSPKVAPAKGKAAKKTIAGKGSPKPKKPAKTKEPAGPREGSKTAQVLAMLQRNNGATIAEVMKTMGWQRHTVRGFMAGAMKKAGYQVESFKPEGGERTYRLHK